MRRLWTKRPRESEPPARPNGPATGTCLIPEVEHIEALQHKVLHHTARLDVQHAEHLDVPHAENLDDRHAAPLDVACGTSPRQLFDEIGSVKDRCMMTSWKRGRKPKGI